MMVSAVLAAVAFVASLPIMASGQCTASSAAAACSPASCALLFPQCANFSCTNSTGSQTCSSSPTTDALCTSCCSLASCPVASTAPSPATTATASDSTNSPQTNASTAAPGGTAAPLGTTVTECDTAPDASVNMIFSVLSRDPGDLDVLRTKIADYCGVVVTRVLFITRHGQHGTPFGNLTLLPVTFISSSKLGECNISNLAAAATLMIACNADAKPAALVELGLMNCSLVPIGAKVHVFPVRSTTDQVYLVIYVGVAVLYASFSAWVIQKFVLAINLEIVEHAKQEKEAEEEAARLGLPSPKTAGKTNKKKAPPQRGRGVPRGSSGGGPSRSGGEDAPNSALLVMPTSNGKNASGADEVDEEQQAVLFCRSDVDEQSMQSMREVIRTLNHRMGADFARKEMEKFEAMNREMVPVVNPVLLKELEMLEMPPVASSKRSPAGFSRDDDDDDAAFVRRFGRPGSGQQRAAATTLDLASLPQLPPTGLL
jgi:hypothetical protein